jgi:MFS family permease
MSDEPRYRWVIVAAVAAILGIAFGQLVNGLSAFFVPIEAEFGWPRGDVAAINSAGLLGMAGGSLVIGMVASRVGIRALALGAALIIGLVLLIAARASALWQFYVIFLVAGAAGAALFAPLIALTGNWFRTGAGLAIGIVSAGQGLGQGVVPFGGALLIESLGWRGAFTAFGILSLVTLVPLALMLRPPPAATAASVAAASTDAGLPRWLVVVALSVAALGCCTGMAVPLMHLVPLIQGCGFDAPAAGSVLLTMMISAVLGRVAFGKLADIVGAIPAYAAAVAWQTLPMLAFTQFDTLEAFYLFAPAYGFGYGGVMTGVLVTIRALTPAASRASTTAIVLAFAWIGHGLGGWQGGATFDATGSYVWGYGNATLSGLVTLTVLGLLSMTLRRSRGAPTPA